MTLARRREAVEAGTIVDILMHQLSLLFALNIVKLTLISEKISKGGRPPLEEAGAFLDNLPPQKLRKDSKKRLEHVLNVDFGQSRHQLGWSMFFMLALVKAAII